MGFILWLNTFHHIKSVLDSNSRTEEEEIGGITFVMTDNSLNCKRHPELCIMRSPAQRYTISVYVTPSHIAQTSEEKNKWTNNGKNST